MSVSVEDIRAAADAIAGEVVRTPTVRSGPLSDLLGLEVFVKLETLQRTGSFKDPSCCVHDILSGTAVILTDPDL